MLVKLNVVTKNLHWNTICWNSVDLFRGYGLNHNFSSPSIIIIKAFTRTAWAKACSQKWKLLKSFDFSFWEDMWHDHHTKTWRTNLSTQSCRKNTQKSLWIFAVIKRERTWPLRFKKVMIMLLEKTYQQFRVDLFRHKNRHGGTYGDIGDLSFVPTYFWLRKVD